MFRIINFTILNLFQCPELLSIQIVFILDFFFFYFGETITSADNGSFIYFFFSSIYTSHFFSCHSALANTANMVLNNSSSRRHSCFIANLEGNASNGLPQV